MRRGVSHLKQTAQADMAEVARRPSGLQQYPPWKHSLSRCSVDCGAGERPSFHGWSANNHQLENAVEFVV